MADKRIRRNDPCPCGSGKRYNRCCKYPSQRTKRRARSRTSSKPFSTGFRQDRSKAKPPLSPRFQFQPGSYGGAGRFMPSIACLQQTTPGNWEHHFVIVKPSKVYTKQESAVFQAEKDLDAAFLQKERSGSDYAVGEYLSAKGYLSVNDFKIVKD